jgi:GDP-L-fucose synthase
MSKVNSTKSKYIMNNDDRIYVAGHLGMVGSALVRKLKQAGLTKIITRTSRELDLRNQKAVLAFFENEKPNYVFVAAAKVGGILANNTYRGEFLYDNLMIQNNIIDSARRTKIKKMLFLGSSCIYPKYAEQPLKEDALMTGVLESTNEPYAIAKIAGIKLCDAYRSQYGCNFISVMPTNLYGPNDNYNVYDSHVLPALLRKMIEAKDKKEEAVEIWGTGTPMREFLHVDDLAEACYFLMGKYNEPGHVNIGCGQDISIHDLALLVKKVVGFTGNLIFDTSKPDGTPRKLMDVSKINELGWKASIPLEEGISRVYEELKKAKKFIKNQQ